MSKDMAEILTGIPTLGSVRERLSFFACKTEEGELNTTLNNAMLYIEQLEKEVDLWMGVAEQFAEGGATLAAFNAYIKARKQDAHF